MLLPFVSAHIQSAFAIEKKISYEGIYYGYILDVEVDPVRSEPRSITIQAIEPRSQKVRFYLDRQTEVYEERKRKKKSFLEVGQKTAVRYFGQAKINLAEAVYVVEGDFEPDKYKKKIYVAPKPVGEEKVEDKKGEKKEEKKGH